jgi:hypothetical protein
VATIYADAQGNVHLRTDRELVEFGPYPNAAESRTFDETNNTALITDLRASTDPYRLNGGVLTKNDTPVVIAADGEPKQATTELADQYAAAITRLNQIIDFVGTPTAAQVYDAVQDIALYLRKTLRYLEAQR